MLFIGVKFDWHNLILSPLKSDNIRIKISEINPFRWIRLSKTDTFKERKPHFWEAFSKVREIANSNFHGNKILPFGGFNRSQLLW